MLLEVKGGVNVTIADLRALHSVLEREEGLMAGLITMKSIEGRKRQNFERLIAQAGSLEIMGRNYPKMQILSVEQIFQGWLFNTPGAVKLGDPQTVIPLTIPQDNFTDDRRCLIQRISP